MGRRLLASLLALITILAPAQLASAEEEVDETILPGYHAIVVEDTVEFFRQFSYLTRFKNGKEFSCPDMGSGDCRTLQAAMYNVILPRCESRTQLDCIAGLRVTDGERVSEASFERYTMPKHPALFKGDNRRLLANPQSPSVWDLSDFPHASGTKYVVHAGFTGGINRGAVTSSEFYAQIYAIEETVGRGESFDDNNYSNLSWCNFNPKTRAIIGCGGGGNTADEVCVVQFQVGGTCGAKREIPENLQLTLNLRLSKEPNGWYHGRLSDPSVNLVKSGKGMILSVTGSTVPVPTLQHAANYRDMPVALKRYWNTCVKNWDCPKSTRQAGAVFEKQTGEERNITSEQKAWSPRALETVKFFKAFTDDSSPKVETVWAVRSLQNTNVPGGRCFSSRGFKGLITTNATAYSDGPPTLSRGILRYSLAAPSRAAETGEEVSGSYNLVMRTSFARCIYGGRNVSPRAEISITAVDGDYKISTSVTSKNKNWIRVSANNFSY